MTDTVTLHGTTEDGCGFEVTRHRNRLALVVGDSLYDLNAKVREGAANLAARIPYNVGNPYRYGSASHDDWNYGHELAQDDKLAAILALSGRELARLMRRAGRSIFPPWSVKAFSRVAADSM